MATIEKIAMQDRELLRPLINVQLASEATLSYYALEHPGNLVELYVNFSSEHNPDGFLVSAKTGYDLFRPLILPSVPTKSLMEEMLRQVLVPPKPILIQVPFEQQEWIQAVLSLQNMLVSELLIMDTSGFEPILNVLMVESETPGNLPRFEIQSKSGSKAIAGVNWRGRRFAEVYVDADQEAVERKFALSVLSGVCSKLIDENLIPLFQYEKLILGLGQLEKLGFRSTESRYLFAHAELIPSAGSNRDG